MILVRVEVVRNTKSVMAIKVEQILLDKKIGYTLIPLKEKAYTVSDVVTFTGGQVKADEICKTIILRDKKTGNTIAVFLLGNHKIDFAKAKKIFGQNLAIASPEEVLAAAGVEPGAVCPFLLAVPLFVDAHVMGLKNIHCGSGDHLFGLEFQLADLEKVVPYQIVDIAKSNT